MSYIKRVAEKNLSRLLAGREIVIVLGARQVGKTTLVSQVLRDRKTVFLNLDFDPDKQKLLALSAMAPVDILSTLGKPNVLVIDEAQRLPETARIVKGWFDKRLPLKVVLLGSSSLDILDSSAESLTGRNRKLILPPLVFKEILANLDWYSKNLKSPQVLRYFGKQIEVALEQNLIWGSYPKIITAAPKKELLDELVSDYLFKDIYQLGLTRDPQLIKRLLSLLALQVGSEVSTNELANNLSVARPTIDRYLELLERTYVIFRLPAFSENPRKEIAKSHKIFFLDTGVRNALLGDFGAVNSRGDIGMLWENWVVAEFYKRNLLLANKWQLYFWRSHAGGEVDLVLKRGRQMRAYEIKWQAKKIGRSAFAERYKTKVKLINRENPLVEL